jgi:predicted RNase H-like nuclease (RuvC/YqgF family)
VEHLAVSTPTMTPEEVLVVLDICAEHIPDGCDVYHAQLEEARATVTALIEEREQLKADLEAFRDGSEQMALAGIKMREEINNLKIKCSAKQAEIDRLMLEYCPEDMTAEQMKEWEEHQIYSNERVTE